MGIRYEIIQYDMQASFSQKIRTLLMKSLFLVTPPHVILMAASIGHYWWRTSLLVTWSRFSTSWSCSARLCFELSRLLLLIKYGSAQFLCVLHLSKKKFFAMEDSRMSTSYFHLQAVLWRESRLRILWSSAETSHFTGSDVIIMDNEYLPPALVVR